MEQRSGDSGDDNKKVFEELREGHTEGVDEAPHRMHAGRVLAIFDLIDIGVVVTRIHGKFFLTNPTFTSMPFEVLTKLITENAFFFAPTVKFYKIPGYHRFHYIKKEN